jgi:polysaccharide biosynthesis protein PslH
MRLLFASHLALHPADNGAKLRTLHIARQFARHYPLLLVCPPAPSEALRALESFLGPGAEVVTAQPTPGGGTAGLLSPLPRDVLPIGAGAPFATALAEHAARWGADTVIVSDPVLGEHLRLFPRLLRIVDLAQEYTLYIRRAMRRAPIAARLLWWMRLAKWRRYTRGLASHADLWLVPAEADRAALRELLPPTARVAAVPNGVDVAYNAFVPAQNAPPQVCYCGALSFEPNRDAALYLCREIWPLVRRRVPEARLLLTGASDGAPAALRATPGVVLTGYVPDVRAVLASCRATLVPLRLGVGTRLKILEALALGTPVVATPLGAEGIAVRDGEHLLLGETPEVLAAHVVTLIESHELRARLAQAGRRLVEQHYSWDVIGAGLITEIEQALAGRALARSTGWGTAAFERGVR